MYGLIVPPGVSPEVAEALEGTHGNPAIGEMQTRMAQREFVESLEFTLPQRMRECYLPSDSKWGIWGERYGRQ